MKTILDDMGHYIYSIMQSIKADRHSWRDWHCLQIELPPISVSAQKNQLTKEINNIIENHLSNTSAQVIHYRLRDILILGKNIPEHTLNSLAEWILNHVSYELHLGGSHTLYDAFQDAEELVSQYPMTELLHTDSNENHRKNDIRIQKSRYKSAPPWPKQSYPKALLVEDDEMTRWMARLALKGECLLATASDANQAIHVYQDYKPDIVFLDINLPGKSGHELLKNLLQTDPGAYIVMLSSCDDIDNIISTIETGAKGFIAKPFDKEQLLYYLNKKAV